MRPTLFLLPAVMVLAGVAAYVAHASGQSNGAVSPILVSKIPRGYRDWKLISVAALPVTKLSNFAIACSRVTHPDREMATQMSLSLERSRR